MAIFVQLEPLVRHAPSNDWMTLVIVASLLLMMVARTVDPAKFRSFFELVFTDRLLIRQRAEKSARLFSAFNIAIFGMQTLTAGLFILLLAKSFAPEWVERGELVRYFQATVGYLLFVVFKAFLEKIIGELFSLERLIDQHLLTKLSYRNLISVFVLLVCTLCIYTLQDSRPVLLAASGIVVLLNLAALWNGYSQKAELISKNGFYFILYLCTLEILPYFLLYKTIA